MKVLIVYSNKYGVTEEAALQLKSKFDKETHLININKQAVPSISDFDCIIFGSSVYVGQINKKIKEFVAANEELLLSKALGLFICCGLPENLEQHFAHAYSDQVLSHAIKSSFGGELRIDKMKFGDKILTGMMLKASAKEGKAPPKINPEQIDLFAQNILEHLSL